MVQSLGNGKRKRRRRKENPIHKKARESMDYDALFAKQEGKCAICKKPWNPLTKAGAKARRMHRDHNHSTLQPRGLLCQNCNRHLKDKFDTEWYRAAWEYLTYYERINNG